MGNSQAIQIVKNANLRRFTSRKGCCMEMVNDIRGSKGSSKRSKIPFWYFSIIWAESRNRDGMISKANGAAPCIPLTSLGDSHGFEIVISAEMLPAWTKRDRNRTKRRLIDIQILQAEKQNDNLNQFVINCYSSHRYIHTLTSYSTILIKKLNRHK